jgi:hypothetical protein
MAFIGAYLYSVFKPPLDEWDRDFILSLPGVERLMEARTSSICFTGKDAKGVI